MIKVKVAKYQGMTCEVLDKTTSVGQVEYTEVILPMYRELEPHKCYVPTHLLDDMRWIDEPLMINTQRLEAYQIALDSGDPVATIRYALLTDHYQQVSADYFDAEIDACNTTADALAGMRG